MPELPEVECLSRAINGVVGKWRLETADFYREDLRSPIPVKDFKRNLEGKTLKSVSRRSKYMIWDMVDYCGVFHLGMSGKMLELNQQEPQIKHTHAVFSFCNPRSNKFRYLHFIDPRRFGRIDCCAAATLESLDYFSQLGPEPLDIKNLGAHLFAESRRRSVPIKNFIMDGSVVVGVGNIYASEALFRAKILPERPASKVDKKSYDKLGKHIVSVLSEAISAGGTTFRDYRHSDGGKGEFKLQLAVYGRKGHPCVTCHTPILERRLGGRSSFYCPSCQH